MKPLLASVVICTRNRAAALRQYSLPSLARQEHPPWEVVVVDDASTDDTPAVAAAYSSAFERFIYVRNDLSRGLCYARNLGARQATGDVIAFMDDDSMAFPYWLSELLKPYEADAKVMCVGGKSLAGDSVEVYGHDRVILGCNMSFAKAVFARYAFDENLYFNHCSWFDETDLVNRLICHQEKVVYNDQATMRHYCLPGEHRRQSEIGGSLNYLYMSAKMITPQEYLSRVWRYVLCGQNVPDVCACLPDSTSWGFCATGSLLRRNSGLNLANKVWILTQVLLVIPYRAQLTRRAEQRQVGAPL